MNINYWDCEYQNYEEWFDGNRIYRCTHPNGEGVCNLDNKYCDAKDDCLLLNSGADQANIKGIDTYEQKREDKAS